MSRTDVLRRLLAPEHEHPHAPRAGAPSTPVDRRDTDGVSSLQETLPLDVPMSRPRRIDLDAEPASAGAGRGSSDFRGHHTPVVDVTPAARRGRGTGWRFALVAVLIALVLLGSVAIVTSAFVRGVSSLNPFRNGIVHHTTVDRSGPAVLKAVSDLGQFRAASGYYEVVVDLEDDVDHVPSFLAGERVLFVAAGSVDAAVDLRALGDGSVSVDADRTHATLRLPAPTLTNPVIDTERSHVFSRSRGLANRISDAFSSNPGSEQEVYRVAQRRLAEAARSNRELTDRAETNTRATLVGLLRSLGFTDVTVEFTPAR